jgi:hypothetical protein
MRDTEIERRRKRPDDLDKLRGGEVGSGPAGSDSEQEKRGT